MHSPSCHLICTITMYCLGLHKFVIFLFFLACSQQSPPLNSVSLIIWQMKRKHTKYYCPASGHTRLVQGYYLLLCIENIPCGCGKIYCVLEPVDESACITSSVKSVTYLASQLSYLTHCRLPTRCSKHVQCRRCFKTPFSYLAMQGLSMDA